MDLMKLFSDSSPSVLGFITKLSIGPSKPHFPEIFGTGFFVDSCGLAATNRHVTEVFSQLMPHPSSPWRNPFFLSDGSDNGDSGSFEMDEAAEAKNKGLCYRCTSGSA